MGIENDAKQFLVLIVQTVSTIILWFLINIMLGIYFQFGLFENKPTMINIGYYLFFALGCFFLLKILEKDGMH